ncbi:MAG: ABC transporter permease [Candidatus Omnitrophica bacterium]|nr:ABC transporter permease [Candidatus Omnitrophota bacterium]
MIPELFLAWRYLFRGKTRHISFIGIVSCLGIALGVATLIVVISVMNGFDRDLMDRLMRFNQHLTIECVDQEQLAEVEGEIETWEGIETASVSLQTQVFAKFDNLVMPLAVKGVDFQDKEEREALYKYITRETASEGFFVGEGLRRRFFILDAIEFYPLKKKLRLEEATVRGSFKVGLYDIDNNFLITDLERAKSLSDNYLLFLGVRVSDPYKAKEVKNKILAKFDQGVFVSTWMESNQVFFAALQLEKVVMFIILSLIILVAAFNIFATLTVGVTEKTKDIGVLKSLGFTRKRIARIFSLQGLLLGFIGTLSGTALGLGLCIVLEKFPFIKLPQEIYYIEYLPMAIKLQDIGLIILVGIVLSFIFSLLPAMKAAKLQPSEALRYE